jgi:hypothetical protein
VANRFVKSSANHAIYEYFGGIVVFFSGRVVQSLWRGDSSELDAVDVSVSSYFDRLWDRGQKKRRWFIVLKKLVL